VGGRRGRARLPAAQHARARGFTFIELTVVIAIVAVMSALVVVNLGRVSVGGQLSSAARLFGNQVLLMRDLAALQQRDLHLEVDLDNDRWRLIDVPSPNEVPDPRDREDRTYHGQWHQLDRGVLLEDLAFGRDDVERRGTLLLVFGRDGELTPSGFVAYFRHEDLPETDGVSVEVSGLTGLVAYHEGRVVPDEVRRASDF
jgi:prepilin-type N-terminal cleavage/methylation domain-containing protein